MKQTKSVCRFICVSTDERGGSSNSDSSSLSSLFISCFWLWFVSCHMEGTIFIQRATSPVEVTGLLSLHVLLAIVVMKCQAASHCCESSFSQYPTDLHHDTSSADSFMQSIPLIKSLYLNGNVKFNKTHVLTPPRYTNPFRCTKSGPSQQVTAQQQK